MDLVCHFIPWIYILDGSALMTHTLIHVFPILNYVIALRLILFVYV